MLDFSLLESVFAGLFLATGLVMVYVVATEMRTQPGMMPGPKPGEGTPTQKMLPIERE